MKRNISFLIGSGFSRPDGMRMAWGEGGINDRIASTKAKEILIHTDGYAFYLEGQENKYEHYNYTSKLFVEEFIEAYCTSIVNGRENFHYEDFYDFYYSFLRVNENQAFIEKFCEDFRNRHGIAETMYENARNLISQFHDTFVQLLRSLLAKAKYYEDVAQLSYYPYDNFLRFLLWLKDDSQVHVHTLNHDLLFEFLGNKTSLSSFFCDGYSDAQSPYFGSVRLETQIIKNYKVRLRYFQNKYDKEICLFKLHGSIDTYSFDISDRFNDRTRVKRDYAVGDIFKEIQDEATGSYKYVRGLQTVYPDFLSGTTEKMRQYADSYYQILFDHFKNNLGKADKLIVTGYGFKDGGINEILVDHFLSTGKQMIVIDPYRPKSDLIHKYNVVMIEKGITEVDFEQFQSLVGAIPSMD